MPEIPSGWIERGSTVFVEHVIEEYRTAGPSRWWVCRCGQTGAAVGLDRAEKAVVAGRAHVVKALLTAVVLDGCEVRTEYGLRLKDGTEWWSALAQFCNSPDVLDMARKYRDGSAVIRRTVLTHTTPAVPVEERNGSNA